MVLLAFVIALGIVALVGALYQAHIRRHPPHDLSALTTEGLPGEASIRSGELGGATASYLKDGLPPPL